MRKEEFEAWLDLTGYTTINDWNYQTIDGWNYYWLINPQTNKFALIRDMPTYRGTYYEVLVKDYVDYNGWADKFHEETRGIYK